MRNALAHAGKTQRRMVSAAIGTVFVQESADAARTQWRSVADQLRGKFPKLGVLMDAAENDVLAFMTFPRAHWTQIYSTNPLERLNAEIKRRTNVVGIFPNDASTLGPHVGCLFCLKGSPRAISALVENPVKVVLRWMGLPGKWAPCWAAWIRAGGHQRRSGKGLAQACRHRSSARGAPQEGRSWVALRFLQRSRSSDRRPRP